MEKGDGFTRDVVQGTVDAINAGSMGPHVTASASFAPRPEVPRASWLDTLDTLVSAIMESGLPDLDPRALRTQIERDVADVHSSVEYIQACWVDDWGVSKELGERIAGYIANARKALATPAAGTTTATAAKECAQHGVYVVDECPGCGFEKRTGLSTDVVTCGHCGKAMPFVPVTSHGDEHQVRCPACGLSSSFAGKLAAPTPAADEIAGVDETGGAGAETSPPVANPAEIAVAKVDENSGPGAKPPTTTATASSTATSSPPTSSSDSDPMDPEGRGPYAAADAMLRALKVARRAAPRKSKDQPAVAYLVIKADPDRCRILLSARDGHRWHTTFVPTSHPVRFPLRCISLECANSLMCLLDLAVKQFRSGANVRFGADSGSDLIWLIANGQPEPMTFQLVEYTERDGDGWKAPSFVAPEDERRKMLVQYDARAMAEATTWPDGGAVVKRDEIDIAGRRHINLASISGDELLRAVIVSHGQTDGLPEDRQQEIKGTLTPDDPRRKPKPAKGKAGKAKKGEETATPAGPATLAPDDSKWRLERRNAEGSGYHTVVTGTKKECTDAIKRASEGGATLRVMRPDGTVDKHIEPKRTGKSEAKRVSAPGKKSKAPPIVHRGPKPSKAKPAKPAAKPTKPTKPKAKGPKPKVQRELDLKPSKRPKR